MKQLITTTSTILSLAIFLQEHLTFARLTGSVQQTLGVVDKESPPQQPQCKSPYIEDTWSFPANACAPPRDPSYDGTFSDSKCTLLSEECKLVCREIPGGPGSCACGNSWQKEFQEEVCIEIGFEFEGGGIGGGAKTSHCVSVANTFTCNPGKCQKCKVGYCAYVNVAMWECEETSIWGGDPTYVKKKTASIRNDGVRTHCKADLSCEGCCPKKKKPALGNVTAEVIYESLVDTNTAEVVPYVTSSQDTRDVNGLAIQFTDAYTERMLCSIESDESEHGFENIAFQDMNGNAINIDDIDCDTILAGASLAGKNGGSDQAKLGVLP